ncbi:MAG: AAA family ATPase [Methylacidiphilales bacterium]|nr:AAA family ATPase [Candidatus Methylacidiphilales bacterium]
MEDIKIDEMLKYRDQQKNITYGFTSPGLSFVYGFPGSFKSMLMSDLAVACATGKPWLKPVANTDIPPINTQKSSVIYVDLANGKNNIMTRFGALLRGYGINSAKNIPLHVFSASPDDLSAKDKQSMNKLKEKILSFNASMVFIDVFSLPAFGIKDDDPDIAGTLYNIKKITEDCLCCMVIIYTQLNISPRQNVEETTRQISLIDKEADFILRIERLKQIKNQVLLRPLKCKHAYLNIYQAEFQFSHWPNTNKLCSASFSSFQVMPPMSVQKATETFHLEMMM